MTTHSEHVSAKIYLFRPKARQPVPTQPNGAGVDHGGAVPEIVYGSSWYHEAAIQGAERPRKPPR